MAWYKALLSPGVRPGREWSLNILPRQTSIKRKGAPRTLDNITTYRKKTETDKRDNKKTHPELCNVHECMYVSVLVYVCVSVRQCAFSPWVLTQINDLWNRDAGSIERFQHPVEYRE